MHHIDISEIHSVPNLVRVAEEVQKPGTPCILKQEEGEIVLISPVKPAKMTRANGRVLTHDDPLWRLVGSAKDAKPTDASRKYEYLAKATDQ